MSIILTDKRGRPTTESVGSVTGYDAARTSNQRSGLVGFPINSRDELKARTRKEIVRKVRALDACLGFVGRLKTKVGQHAVGKGVFPRWITADEEWNQAMKAYLEPRLENPDIYSLDGSRDFYEDQRLAAESPIDDGEYFAALVRSEETGRLQVQPLDVFEVEQPQGVPGVNLAEWFDGVKTDPYGRALAYAVRELATATQGTTVADRFVSAAEMVHVFKRRRAKQWRGLPAIYAGVNSLIDVLDLRALVTGSAKLHEAMGMVVRKKKGEAGKNGVTGNLEKILGTGGKVTEVSENFLRGAAIQYMDTDEGIDLLTSDRPTPNILAFMEWLYRDAAESLGLPVEAIRDLSKLGGATARAVLEDAQWFFEMAQDRVVMRHSRRILLAMAAEAMRLGEVPICRDPKWWQVEWQGPAKLTVDIGRTADANIKLMRNGLQSFESYYEERGLDARTQHTRQVEHLAWLQKLCDEKGVDMRLILEPTPGVQLSFNAPDGGGSQPTP